MLKVLHIVSFFLLLLPLACKKGGCNVIESIPVLEQVSMVQYSQLYIPNGVAVTERGGVAGLIIVNTGNGYIAFDRCSTVNPEKRCAVVVEESGVVAKDPCSGARYLLVNGSPAELAECPLKRYRARRSGETIIVSN
ncbi:hypothetical protein GCM10011386_13630 [Parapedobacter defluvii]|uniref:Rieske domain-containing protein n=2 Tax=Parapedobacter defluvii TaxID=2045106 RepID=A0ABQ1LJ63_9SPHI|nr:hypothetical protein GCM10011386_13630 [Parapedobacter defluvii]